MAAKNDGTRLERKFSAWLRSTRGYQETRLRHLVRGAASVRPYEVDVAGTRRRPWALWVGILALLGLLAEMVLLVSEHEPQPAIVRWLATEVGLTAVAFFCLWLRVEHVWAECKDVARGISRDHVLKLARSVEDVKKYPLGWKPRRVCMVTSTRFQQDALALAHASRFECYRETAEGFEPVPPVPSGLGT